MKIQHYWRVSSATHIITHWRLQCQPIIETIGVMNGQPSNEWQRHKISKNHNIWKISSLLIFMVQYFNGRPTRTRDFRKISKTTAPHGFFFLIIKLNLRDSSVALALLLLWGEGKKGKKKKREKKYSGRELSYQIYDQNGAIVFRKR